MNARPFNANGCTPQHRQKNQTYFSRCHPKRILITIVSAMVYLLAVIYRGNTPYLGDLSSHSFDLSLIWQLLPLAR
jgi:hypothetical protein